MQKLLGYICSILGLVGIIASSGKLKESIPFLTTIPTQYILIPSIILIARGLLFLIIANKGSSGKKVEVPI